MPRLQLENEQIFFRLDTHSLHFLKKIVTQVRNWYDSIKSEKGQRPKVHTWV